MKSDLNQLMAERKLDAMVISGKVLGNPPLIYMLNGAKLTRGQLVQKRDAVPHLIVSPIEREEAAAAGYPVILNTRYQYRKLLEQHAGDVLAASVAYQRRVFEDLHVAGRVGYYGYADQGETFTFLNALNEASPAIEIVGEYGTNILQLARATKDASEVQRIQSVGQRTAEVVRQTVAFLQQHPVGADEILRHPQSRDALTVGDVHAHIRNLIAQQGLEDPEGFIFATGRDAGIPHSRGNLVAPMRLGESIVFDIFPREIGGGYFFDLTRTFCLGYAPEAVQRLYGDVQACLEQLKSALVVGEQTRHYQRMACDFFHERGHPTVQHNPATLEGYVHGLGHGVGLDIHEAPGFHDNASNDAGLQAGNIFTLEPGLYYPDQGMGCRLEDVVWIDEHEDIHILTQFPYDLAVPMT